MSRRRGYIETDVLTEAKARLHHIMDTHDDFIVAFSGGKDSLALLHLTREVAAERGITRIKAVFRDEELISGDVIDFVATYMNLDWLDLEWWCVPLQSHKFVLGEMADYVQWDASRPWVREMPDFAMREEDLGLKPGTVLSQYTADDVAIRNLKGKVCILTGVRASESLMRWQSCVNKLNENYIVATPASKRATMGRPLFDWEENDVFRYFYDNDIAYCPIYDQQTWAAYTLRVCSAIASEPAKVFHKWREFAPDLYENVVDVFPEMRVQERYFRELDKRGLEAKYAESWDTIRDWINENIPEARQRNKALTELRGAETRARLTPGAYPLDHVLRAVMANGGKRTILPKKDKKKVKA